MDKISALKGFGLSDLEAETYMTLLKLGGATPSELAKDMGIKRTTAYPLLQNLRHKGFALLYLRKKKKIYYAQKPKRVASLLEHKVDLFTILIPEFETLEKRDAERIGLQFLETKKEVEQFYLSLIEEMKNQEYTIIGNERGWQDIDPLFLKEVHRRLKRNKVRLRMVLSADSPKETAEHARDRSVRYLPSNYSFQSTIDIFPDKILLVSPKLNAVAVVIAVPAMVDVFRTIFELLWQMGDASVGR